MKKVSSGFLFGSLNKASSVNDELRRYMLGIYNYMTIGLMLSAVVAFFAAKTGIAVALFSSPIGIIVSLAPIGISFYIAARFHSMSHTSVLKSFMLYAAIMGLSLSTIFVVFSYSEITLAFCITASMFASMSIYGYVTKKDLSSFGSIMIMAIWGLLISSVVNMFMHSTALTMGISCVSVLVFSGMVAFDTQKLKQIYYMMGPNVNGSTSKIAIFGAMQLYIDFVAIFVNMLQLLRMGRDN